MGLKDTLTQALDDEIELDLSQARDEVDFSQPVECRQYEFEIIGAEKGTSKGGNPKVAFRLKIVEDCPAKGRTFFKHAPTKGEGAGIFRDVWKACGLELGATVKPADAVGKHVLGTVRFQKDSDELQEVVFLKAPKGKAGAKSSSRRLG